MKKLAVLMDPIDNINIKKDSTFALMLEAQQRGWQVFYFELGDLFMLQNIVFANAASIQIFNDTNKWFELGKRSTQNLTDFDAVLLRKDPPFDEAYLTATYLLECASLKGAKIFNDPKSVRDANEKIFATHFAEFMPETLVASDADALNQFIEAQQDVILKPLYAMGGYSIFRVKHTDGNRDALIELMTERGQTAIMAQSFIPEIATSGDKRVLIIDGKVIPHALARIPAKGAVRGNLAAGGTGELVELNDNEMKIANAVANVLKQKDLLFVGLDLIGEKLTEINVTCPTCIQEISRGTGENLAGMVLERIEAKL